MNAATLTLTVNGQVIAQDDTYKPTAVAGDIAMVEAFYALSGHEADLSKGMRLALSTLEIEWPEVTR